MMIVLTDQHWTPLDIQDMDFRAKVYFNFVTDYLIQIARIVHLFTNIKLKRLSAKILD